MYPLHKDMTLNEEQLQIVSDYVKEVGFCLPGTAPEDFQPRAFARYLGWEFMSEDLEAYGVGLYCTKPGFEKYYTFIRMSYGQLMGDPNAPRLPVNDPVLATDTLRMHLWWSRREGPARSGVDTYDKDDGSVPGVDQDLRELGDILGDILHFAQQGKGPDDKGKFDLAVDWGTLLAGRYPRLQYFQNKGMLTREQEEALTDFETVATGLQPTLEYLSLPTLATIARPEARTHEAHHDKTT